MNSEEMRGAHVVEVWFPIEKDADGYPKSKEWEQLLAHCTEKEYEFQIASVPFFLKNVSRGDVVRAQHVSRDETDYFQFERVTEHAGHNTYRLLPSIERSADKIASELVARGLTVELQEGGRLLAVDVPPDVDQGAADAFLMEGAESGRWEMQDGHICSATREG